MKLTKIIPSRRKTVEFLFCKKDFAEMSDDWNNARKRLRKKLDKCYWCNHRFKNGEMMAIACPKKKEVNKILCQKCADELTNDIT